MNNTNNTKEIPMDKDNRIVFLGGEKIDLVIPNLKRHMHFLHRFIMDREINAWLTRGDFPINEKQEIEWFERDLKQENIVLVIEDKDGVILGTIGLHNINWQDRVGVLGILIGAKDRWGQGIATEAEKLIVKHAFNIGLHKVIADVYLPNKASARVLEKIGFQQEGQRRRHKFKNGEWLDVLEYGLLKEEFKD
jgi:RimJ/RimL family protein N-acetyltransferase